MAIDLKTLRSRAKNKSTSFAKLAEQFDNEANPSKGYEDKRFWKPERDKAGNATATIRFLDASEGEELPWVKVYSHGFKGPNGRWYIENSLTTIGQSDPCSELNMQLWNSTDDDKSPIRDQVRRQKRKLHYIANILVVNDPKHPENNGKVFLFKFGKKIFDKIMDKARPTFEDEEPVNVFDYWEGANFKLRIKTVDRFPNYDSSEFDAPEAVASSDEEIVAIANQQFKLGEFLDPKNFKTYEELKKRLDMVLGATVPVTSAAKIAESEMPVTKSSSPSTDEDEDEDLQNFLESLNDED